MKGKFCTQWILTLFLLSSRYPVLLILVLLELTGVTDKSRVHVISCVNSKIIIQFTDDPIIALGNNILKSRRMMERMLFM